MQDEPGIESAWTLRGNVIAKLTNNAKIRVNILNDIKDEVAKGMRWVDRSQAQSH